MDAPPDPRPRATSTPGRLLPRERLPAIGASRPTKSVAAQALRRAVRGAPGRRTRRLRHRRPRRGEGDDLFAPTLFPELAVPTLTCSSCATAADRKLLGWRGQVRNCRSHAPQPPASASGAGTRTRRTGIPADYRRRQRMPLDAGVDNGCLWFVPGSRSSPCSPHKPRATTPRHIRTGRASTPARPYACPPGQGRVVPPPAHAALPQPAPPAAPAACANSTTRPVKRQVPATDPRSPTGGGFGSPVFRTSRHRAASNPAVIDRRSAFARRLVRNPGGGRGAGKVSGGGRKGGPTAARPGQRSSGDIAGPRMVRHRSTAHRACFRPALRSLILRCSTAAPTVSVSSMVDSSAPTQ
jgi:hypothetical protein